MSGLFYYDRDYYSAIAIVLFPIIVTFSCKFYRDSCTAIARCIAFVIVLSRLLFGDCLCYIAITFRYCDVWVCGFSLAIAIVVLYCAFASLLYRDRDSKLLYSDCFLAISRTVSRVLYSDRNCSLVVIIIA